MRATAAAGHALAGALLAATPVSAFLATNGYPILNPEAGMVLAGAAAAGAVVGATAAISHLLAALVLGAGAALCLDFLYGAHLSKHALVLAPFVCVALAVILRRHLALVLGVTSSAFLVATHVVPATPADAAAGGEAASVAGPGAKALPVVLHLVLDEHIGIDGLPQELAESAEVERQLTDAYVGSGFRLYAGAYSEYFDTRNALANLLNFTSHAGAWSHLVEGRSKPYVLTASAYFRHLGRLGYALKVYQSDHIDLCRVPGQTYASCMHYRANSIGAVYAAPLDTAERMRFIRNSFLRTSTYLERLRLRYAEVRARMPHLPFPAWDGGVTRVGPLAVLPVLEQLERDLRSASYGQAYFAHLLIPHYPYVLDERCRVRPKISHWLYSVPLAGPQSGNSEESRTERYRHYFAQIQCQQALLQRLFAAMKAAGVWENAIIVVHGDHGSRISRTLPAVRNADRLTVADFNDAYSTLFAVRKPNLEAGIVRVRRPLQELLAETFNVPMEPLGARVYLRAGPGEPLASRSIQQFP